MSPETRFWAKVNKTETCWLWTGGGNGGYGLFTPIRGVLQIYAHRYAYELLVGPIPKGYEIDHLCHNADPTCAGDLCIHRLCVNPAHLEAVTHAENMRRRFARITHCPSGHEYTPENTYIPASGSRSCRKCANARSRDRHARWMAMRAAAREAARRASS